MPIATGMMTRILDCRHLVFASPIYWYAWYAVMPVMKRFLDRLTHCLDIPDLRDQGRKLRGKTAWVLCTSSHAEADAAFLDALHQMFVYLGMQYGGQLHVDCREGFPEAWIGPLIKGFSGRSNIASAAAGMTKQTIQTMKKGATL